MPSMLRKELAELVGYTYMQVFNINKQLPEGEKLFVETDGKKCDLSIFIKRWCEYSSKRKDKSMTKADLSELTGYSRMQVNNIDKELPESQKLFRESEEGFDLAYFVRQWAEYVANKRLQDILGDEGLNLEQEKAKHEVIKRKKTTLEVRRLKGELIPAKDAQKILSDLATDIKTNFLGLPGRMAPIIYTMDNPSQIADALDGEVRRILILISEFPVPDWITEADLEDEKEEEEDENEEE